MEPKTLITLYVVLLVTTIVLVAMKRTHWGSIIGVAIIPFYFLWVFFDACRSEAPKEEQKVSGPADANSNEDVAVVPPAQKNKPNQEEIATQDEKVTVTDIRKQVIHEYENDSNHLFSAEDFSNADLSSIGLSGAKFAGKVMCFANLSRSALACASFSESNLTGANLSWAVLTDGYLCDANLSNANLTSANLFRANLTGANLKGADLNLADLGQATMPDGRKYSPGMDISKFGATGTPMDL